MQESNSLNVDAIERTIRLIESKSIVFNMREEWKDYCKTPSCIAGFAMAANYGPHDPILRRPAWMQAATLLGLDWRQQYQLFMPRHRLANYKHYQGMDGYISPRRAIGVLRRLMHTGKVSWAKPRTKKERQWFGLE